MKPVINITIPYYNRSSMMRQAIINAINIDYQPKTITIIDDGSPEPADDVIAEFKGTPGLTYLKLNQNVGADSARNVGILLSRYDYITFHDSDDIYDQRKLQLQLDEMIKTTSEVVYCKFIHVDMDHQIHIRGDRINLVRDLYRNVVRERFLSYILYNPGLYARTALVRLGGYAPGHFGGDDDLQYRVVLSGAPIGFVDQPLIVKLDQADSITVDAETGLASRLAQGFYARLDKAIAAYQADPKTTCRPIDLPASLRAQVVFADQTNRPAINSDIPHSKQLEYILEV